MHSLRLCTQFTSQEFKNFIKDWQIDHRITSPTNAQSNGQAERFVQTIKNSLTKAMEGGEDLHLAILSYITTPLNHSLPSPAELLNSRNSDAYSHFNYSNQTHTTAQESDARNEVSTSKTLLQELKGSTQTKDWRCSLHSISA